MRTEAVPHQERAHSIFTSWATHILTFFCLLNNTLYYKTQVTKLLFQSETKKTKTYPYSALSFQKDSEYYSRNRPSILTTSNNISNQYFKIFRNPWLRTLKKLPNWQTSQTVRNKPILVHLINKTISASSTYRSDLSKLSKLVSFFNNFTISLKNLYYSEH